MSTEWMGEAACAAPGVDPEWFFPSDPGLAGNRAKAVCKGCPVQAQCLETALLEPIQGIWGGTSESQRVAMRRERGIRLPSGWAARGGWVDRYRELRDLGFTDVEIIRRWGVKPTSLVRQLDRHGIPVSRELEAFLVERRQGVAAW